jgi:hypothetical protein
VLFEKNFDCDAFCAIFLSAGKLRQWHGLELRWRVPQIACGAPKGMQNFTNGQKNVFATQRIPQKGLTFGASNDKMVKIIAVQRKRML